MARHNFTFLMVSRSMGFDAKVFGRLMGVCQKCGLIRPAAKMPSLKDGSDGFFDVGAECPEVATVAAVVAEEG